jgi:hypothetical protein
MFPSHALAAEAAQRQRSLRSAARTARLAREAREAQEAQRRADVPTGRGRVRWRVVCFPVSGARRGDIRPAED